MSPRFPHDPNLSEEAFARSLGQAMRDSVDSVHASQGLPEAVRGKARRIQRRRTATTMGVGLAVVAIAVSAGSLFRGQGEALDRGPAQPTVSTVVTTDGGLPTTGAPITSAGTATQGMSGTSGARPARVVEVSLDRLAGGPAPGVSYIALTPPTNRLVLSPGTRVEVGRAFSVVPYGSGALVHTSPDLTDYGTLAVVGRGPGGTDPSARSATVPVVDSAGRVAFWAASASSGGAIEQRGADGSVLVTAATGVGKTYLVAGHLGDGVVLATLGAASAGDSLGAGGAVVTTPDGRLRSVPGMIQALTATAAGQLYAGLRTPAAGSAASCAEVRRAADDVAVWSSCKELPQAFSPSGGLMASAPSTSVGAGMTTVTVWDTQTWQAVLQVKLAVANVAFENDTTLLLSVMAEPPGQGAVVRCSVAGACELAETAYRSEASGYTLLAR